MASTITTRIADLATRLGLSPANLIAAISDIVVSGGANIQKGTATLVAGTVTISGITLTATSTILVDYNTARVNADYVYAPLASRNVAAGMFVINSANSLDTSTIDWTVIG